MPTFHCFGSSSSSSQDSSDNTNTNPNPYPKRRRFSLTRSFSFSDTFPTKNVSSFFKTIRKSGSRRGSTVSSRSSPNTDEEDYGSSWTYYPVGHVVRLDGVDFEIVSPPPCVRTPTGTASGAYQPSAQPFEKLASTLSEPSESGGSGSGLTEASCTETAINAPEKQELRRQASLDSQLRYLEPIWRASDGVGTYYRPGSIMMGIDAAIDALMKQQICSLNPGHPPIHEDVLRPLPTGTVGSAIGGDSANLDPNPKPKHRIRRKPVPAF